MASRWRYRLLGEEFGPLSLESLRELVDNGTLGPADEVREGDGEWCVVADCPELQSLPELADVDGLTPTASPPLDAGLESLLNSVSEQSAPAVPGTASGRVRTDDWYCQSNGIELGPLPFEQLMELASSGQIGRGDRVRRGAQGPWQLATEIVGLVPEASTDASGMAAASQGSDDARLTAGGEASAEWYYERNGHTLGPVGLDTLKLLAESGQLSPRDRVREGQGGLWLRAMTLPGLFSNLLATRSRAGQAEEAARARSVEESETAAESGAPPVTAESTPAAAVEPSAPSPPDRWNEFFAEAEARNLKRRGRSAASGSSASMPASASSEPTEAASVTATSPSAASLAAVSAASEPQRPLIPTPPPAPVMPPRPAPRPRRSPSVDFSGLGGTLRNMLSALGSPRVWGSLLALLLLVGLKFAPGLMAGQPGAVDYEPLASLWQRGLQLREQKADAAAWQALATEATPVLDDMQARLAPVVKSRGREVPIAQRILWMVDIPSGPTGASGHMRKLLEGGSTAPDEAVQLGAAIMEEARTLLPAR